MTEIWGILGKRYSFIFSLLVKTHLGIYDRFAETAQPLG
jgi:hypothetical protein